MPETGEVLMVTVMDAVSAHVPALTITEYVPEAGTMITGLVDPVLQE